MDSLEYLIEQEESLNSKIKEAISSLKKWFEEKLRKFTELLEATREKFAKKLSSKIPVGKLKKDIKVKGKILFRKGDNSKKVLSKAKELCSKILNKIKESINYCKAGIKEIGDRKKAKKRKEKILETSEDINNLFTTVTTVLGCLSAAWIFSKDVMEARDYYKNSKSYDKEE